MSMGGTGGERTAVAYVALIFAPGESYQFDWSHDSVVLGGVTTKAKVPQVCLCQSRMPFARAYLPVPGDGVRRVKIYGSFSLSLRSRSPEIS
jgi:hypothetical protein